MRERPPITEGYQPIAPKRSAPLAKNDVKSLPTAGAAETLHPKVYGEVRPPPPTLFVHEEELI